MKYKPHKYQSYATDFIIKNPVSAIFLEMGLGKSVITLTALFDLLLDSFMVGKVLIIAPLRVATHTWSEEIKKWDHIKELDFSLVVGNEKNRLAQLKKSSSIYIINRENFTWLVEKSGVEFDFDMIVVDELSSFKSPISKRFKSMLKVRSKVKRIVGLTGTPSSNGLMDLWAQFRLLDFGQRLGRNMGIYRRRFFIPDKYNKERVFSYKPMYGAKEAIYDLISDITISMKSVDYLDMPSCIYNEVPVYLSEKERICYDRLRVEMALSLGNKKINAINAATLCGKLLQISNGAIYDEKKEVTFIHDRKLDALEDIIENMAGKPLLIAYWFQHDLQRIKSRFPVGEIKTSADIEAWNEGKIPLAVIHPASAGHGLNLQQGGSTIVWFSLIYSLELYQQTNARLLRQGQKENVVIHHLVARGTIDEEVMRILKEKDKLNQKGKAGVVIANGSLSSNTSNEGEIRKNILNNDLVDCIVALPDKLFYTTGIPVCIWFFNRDKKHKGQTLFIDARKMGDMVNRRLRELSDEDINKIADTYIKWQNEDEYEDVKGFCKVAGLDEIKDNDYILTPGRYVGIEDIEDDGEPFEEKMDRLTRTLSEQFAKSRELEEEIRKQLGGIGYEL